MQLTEDEKQKRLQALKDLLSEEDKKDDDEKEDDDAEDDEKEDDDDKKKDDVKESADYKQHLDAMFKGTDLSEDAQKKLGILFEAAVNYEVDRKVGEIKTQLEEELQAAVEANEATLKEEADAYLSYVVTEWTENNSVALKQQVKLDLMENFIGGLRSLFLEHNFNIPEEQTNMVDSLMEKVASLEQDVSALAKKNVQVAEELEKANREIAFKVVTEGMTDMDVEKLKALVESKKFDSTEDFKQGVALIKESYFKKENNTSTEIEQPIISEDEVPASIQAYANMITKSVKK